MVTLLHDFGGLGEDSHAVTAGYTYFITGKVRVDKAEAFAQKMDDLYRVTANTNQRAYAHRCGRACARLWLYPDREVRAPILGEEGEKDPQQEAVSAPMLIWILLAKEGEGLVHERENLEDMAGTSAMLKWADEYQLVRVPRAGKPPSWTWRMTKLEVARWRARIKQTVRRKDRDTQELRQILWSLRRCPGFRGIREDVSRLARFIELEWVRNRGKQPRPKNLPHKIGYVRRLPDELVSLALVAGRMKGGQSPFPRTSRRGTPG